jgi:5-methyltetrahydrofolate--homocysteine methyltransferase
MNPFLKRLSEPGILIADGATGTMLHQLGLPAGMAPERWNLENPPGVRDLHRHYLQAGADVILTKTFGGTRYRLEREKLEDRVQEINRRAAGLAREMAQEVQDRQVYVLGDIGPSGKLIKPLGPLSYDAAVAAFAEQVEGLLAGGVDAILIETMSDLSEARAAVEGTRQAMERLLDTLPGPLPILVTMSFDTRGHTMMGVKPAQAAKFLGEMQVDAIGANCGRTLSETLEAIQAMRQAAPQALLVAKPNAGLPRLEFEEGKKAPAVYDVTPAVMAEWAEKFAALGVKIFGGCCGSTPAHIHASAQALKHH